jgi:hypothetical protein
MRKALFFLVALSLIAATSASAKDMAKRLGLGFITTDAPVGGRYWFSPKAGLDLGFGITSDQRETPAGDKETRTGWSVEVGIPIVIIPVGDRVNFLFNPGFLYSDPGTFGSGDSDTMYRILGSLEFEVFVTGDFSVSAAHGIGVVIESPAGGESTTSWGTFGENVTQFGFHYYLPGGGD